MDNSYTQVMNTIYRIEEDLQIIVGLVDDLDSALHDARDENADLTNELRDAQDDIQNLQRELDEEREANAA